MGYTKAVLSWGLQCLMYLQKRSVTSNLSYFLRTREKQQIKFKVGRRKK